MHLIAIYLPSMHAGNERVPIMIRAVESRIELNDARWCSVILSIEEHQFDAGRATRVQAEIHAAMGDRGAKRTAPAILNVSFHPHRTTTRNWATMIRNSIVNGYTVA